MLPLAEQSEVALTDRSGPARILACHRHIRKFLTKCVYNREAVPVLHVRDIGHAACLPVVVAGKRDPDADDSVFPVTVLLPAAPCRPGDFTDKGLRILRDRCIHPLLQNVSCDICDKNLARQDIEFYANQHTGSHIQGQLDWFPSRRPLSVRHLIDELCLKQRPDTIRHGHLIQPGSHRDIGT